MACSYCREFMRMKNADLMQKSGELGGNMPVPYIAR
jgi:hypothetical protein